MYFRELDFYLFPSLPKIFENPQTWLEYKNIKTYPLKNTSITDNAFFVYEDVKQETLAYQVFTVVLPENSQYAISANCVSVNA